MSNEQKEQIKYSLKWINYAKQILKYEENNIKNILNGGVTTQGDTKPLPPCPQGQVRNAQGICVDDIG